MDRAEYLSKRAREIRQHVEDVVREPLSKVKCGPREIAITLGTGSRDPWIEFALWSPQGAPRERRPLVERGRCGLLLSELETLIDRLQEARSRLVREMRR